MAVLLIVLLIVLIFLVAVGSDDSTSTAIASWFSFMLGLVVFSMMTQTIKEQGVKEYLSDPKKYNIEIKYKQNNDGTYFPCDTIITSLK